MRWKTAPQTDGHQHSGDVQEGGGRTRGIKQAAILPESTTCHTIASVCPGENSLQSPLLFFSPHSNLLLKLACTIDG